MSYTSAVLLLLCTIELCTLIAPLPLEQDVAADRHSRGVGFGFPDAAADQVVKERASNSCYITVTVTETNKTARKCCDGYSGIECNILVDPYRSSDPCNNKTCPNDPEAQCAVIKQCGVDVAIFLNDFGQIVDCGEEVDNRDDHDESTTTNNADTDISTLSCQGFCETDPCKDQSCPSFPDAFCFQSGCSCEPLWILDTGVQVNCTSGTHMDPILTRRRRQAAIIPSSCSS